MAVLSGMKHLQPYTLVTLRLLGKQNIFVPKMPSLRLSIGHPSSEVLEVKHFLSLPSKATTVHDKAMPFSAGSQREESRQ